MYNKPFLKLLVSNTNLLKIIAHFQKYKKFIYKTNGL